MLIIVHKWWQERINGIDIQMSSAKVCTPLGFCVKPGEISPITICLKQFVGWGKKALKKI